MQKICNSSNPNEVIEIWNALHEGAKINFNNESIICNNNID